MYTHARLIAKSELNKMKSATPIRAKQLACATLCKVLMKHFAKLADLILIRISLLTRKKARLT